MSDSEAAIFADRTRWFLIDHERRKTVICRLGTNVFRLPKSGSDGRFSGKLRLSHSQVEQLSSEPGNSRQKVTFMAVLPENDAREMAGSISLFEDSGLTIISDIDDTIKCSFVTDRDKLLRATFLEPMKPVEGMPELYRHWEQAAYGNFCYVSASPWQLYEPLAQFLRSNSIPAGPFFLKNFRWKNKSFLDLFLSPEKYKPSVIESLLKRFPQRKFVLVGDSGELDPEIYGEIARKHHGQIKAIFIREVSVPAGSEERMLRAFRGLRPESWRVFRNPGEIRDALR